MDAKAYLQKQGWRGSGHSLDHTDRGITRPLLVSKKVDVLGLGLNKHAAVSDQWWLRAFDSGLKSLGSGQESALAQAQKHGVSRGGLYARFVKGEGVAGTFEEGKGEPAAKVEEELVGGNPKWKPVDMEKGGKKRKREEKDGEKRVKRKSDGAEKAVNGDSEDEKARKLAKVAKKEEKNAEKIARKEAKLKKAAVKQEINGTAEVEPAVDAKQPKKKAKRDSKRQKSENSSGKDGFTDGADEVKLNGTTQVNGTGTAKQPKALSSEKLVVYTKRAAEKGIPLDTYIRRRDAKTAEKKASKTAAPLGFVVDTEGDEQPQPAKDTASVPLDPSLWEGKPVKSLSKPVREARRQWMRQDNPPNSSTKDREKERAQKKQKARSGEAWELLEAMRRATGKTVKVPSGAEYETWALEGKDGKFTAGDKAMARRRVRHGAKVDKQKVKRGADGEKKGAKKNNRNRQKSREKYRKKAEVKAEQERAD